MTTNKSTAKSYRKLEVNYQCEKCGETVTEADTVCPRCGTWFEDDIQPRFHFLRIAAKAYVAIGILALIGDIFLSAFMLSLMGKLTQTLSAYVPPSLTFLLDFSVFLLVISLLLAGGMALITTLGGYDSISLFISIEENSRRSNRLSVQAIRLLKELLTSKE